jgi:hypothetical protein
MKNQAFWDFFTEVAEPRLHKRASTFRHMFEYMDLFDRPVVIVETGCLRDTNGWVGDGMSTHQFDQYVQHRNDGSFCISVDLHPGAVQACQSIVSARTFVHQADSVKFLANLVRTLQAEGRWIDLLYLDSMDVDFQYWQASAAHHLKELSVCMPRIHKNTLVVVDDSPCHASLTHKADGSFDVGLHELRVGGKGTLIAQVAEAQGAQALFLSYQVGWTQFVSQEIHT